MVTHYDIQIIFHLKQIKQLHKITSYKALLFNNSGFILCGYFCVFTHDASLSNTYSNDILWSHFVGLFFTTATVKKWKRELKKTSLKWTVFKIKQHLMNMLSSFFKYSCCNNFYCTELIRPRFKCFIRRVFQVHFPAFVFNHCK